jgi:hypothetical protein
MYVLSDSCCVSASCRVQGEAGEGDALTPQAAQELMDKCRAYCDDPDPLCLLNIGKGRVPVLCAVL